MKEYIPLFIFIIEDVRNVLFFLNKTSNLGNSIYSKYYLKRQSADHKFSCLQNYIHNRHSQITLCLLWNAYTN